MISGKTLLPLIGNNFSDPSITEMIEQLSNEDADNKTTNNIRTTTSNYFTCKFKQHGILFQVSKGILVSISFLSDNHDDVKGFPNDVYKDLSVFATKSEGREILGQPSDGTEEFDFFPFDDKINLSVCYNPTSEKVISITFGDRKTYSDYENLSTLSKISETLCDPFYGCRFPF